MADVILWSFDFTDDHTHESFMDSVVWSDEDFYYVSFIVGRFTSFSPEIEFCPASKQKFKFSLDRSSILMRWFIVAC